MGWGLREERVDGEEGRIYERGERGEGRWEIGETVEGSR